MTRAEKAALALVMLLVTSAALWNGYPLVYSDSGTYVDSSFGIKVPRDRPVFYGIFLLASHLKLTLWGSVLAQAAIVTFVLWTLVHLCAPGCRAAGFVEMVAMLALSTSLPWFAGQLVPDLFAGVGVLSLFLLLFHHHHLALRDRRVLAALVVLSSVVHLSHLLLAIGLVTGCQVLYWTGRSPGVAAEGRRLAWGCVALSFVLIPTVNLARTGRFFLSETSDAFLLGRLIEDGIVQRLLSERCATEGYVLCPHRGELPSTALEFLWATDGPFARIGGWSAPPAAIRRMIVDSLLAYPAQHFAALVSGFSRQMLAFRTGDGLATYGADTWVATVLHKRFRAESWLFDASRQQSGTLLPAMVPLANLHAWITWVSFAASLAILGFGRPRAPAGARALHAFVWASLLLNAAVVAALSGVTDRYQARLVWMVTLAVLISARNAWRPQERRSVG